MTDKLNSIKSSAGRRFLGRYAAVGIILAVGVGFVGLTRTPTAMGSQKANPLNRDRLREYVGWYEFEPDSVAFLTWSATGDLLLYDVTGRRSFRMAMEGDDFFRWELPKSGRGQFTRGESGAIEGLSWQADDGGEGHARKLSGYEYAQEEIPFANKGVALVGTLLLPRGEGSHPGVVIIHGSGTSHRDNLWYFAIADRFVRSGFAVFFPDKRGSGKSGGKWQTSSMRDFADDTLAAVEILRKHPSVDPDRIGVLGMSQGGHIAPLAASLSSRISFVINVAGGAVTFNEMLVHESKQTLRQNGMPDSFLSVAVSMAKARRPTWWKLNGDYDPVEYWKQVRVPVLTVYGEEDEKDNVPVRKSVTRLRKEIPKELNPDFVVRVFPQTGHNFFNQETKWFREDFLTLLIEWTSSVVKREDASDENHR